MKWLALAAVIAGCGRIGFDTTGVSPEAVPSLVAGTEHVCVRRGTQLLCWGQNDQGQIGTGDTTTTVVPTVVAGLEVADVALGQNVTCALDHAGKLWCWGTNFHGELGLSPPTCGDGVVDPDEGCDDANLDDGDTCSSLCQPGSAPTMVPTPTQLPGPKTWVRVFGAGFHMCALDDAGALYCWGKNDSGDLGVGDLDRRVRPTREATGAQWLAAAPGALHTCAIRTDRTVWCWGAGASGELGQGVDRADQLAPVLVQGIAAVAYDAGQDYGCAVNDDGQLSCWGRADRFQLGLPDMLARDVPTANGRNVVDRFAAGATHACAISAGALACWGSDSCGELGDIGTDRATGPVIPGTWSEVAAGNKSTCALDVADHVWCWGHNGSGQLGNGTRTDSATPVLAL